MFFTTWAPNEVVTQLILPHCIRGEKEEMTGNCVSYKIQPLSHMTGNPLVS